MDSLDVYHILYTRPTRVSVDPLVNSHIAGPLFLLGEYALIALYVGHPLEVVAVMAALCQT